ncbi:MAG: hypothetical protein H7249_03085 [Chitinophagaceae bacterium]|nr:hypothetical protein [Oligoflexus sp.]
MENPREQKRRVLIAESSGPSRILLSEVVRGQGFPEVQAVASLKDAIGILEVEPIDWLITGVFQDQTENILQLLKLCCMTPSLRDLQVSAFFDKSELYLLPEAFELGLMSYHMRPFTKDSLLAEISNIVADFDQMDWNSMMIASQYLRKYLNLAQLFDDLLVFERQLTKLLPGDLLQLLNLVCPLVQTKKVVEALKILA